MPATGSKTTGVLIVVYARLRAMLLAATNRKSFLLVLLVLVDLGNPLTLLGVEVRPMLPSIRDRPASYQCELSTAE